MPVTGSFLRTSTRPSLMMYIEMPGAPSRMIVSDGGKSVDFRQVTSLARLSSGRSAKRPTFLRKPTSWSDSVIVVDMDPAQKYRFLEEFYSQALLKANIPYGG